MSTEERLSMLEANLRSIGLATKRILTFNEAAEFTGISKSYLYKLTSTQRIPHFKPTGKIIFFDREELQAWLAQNRVATIDEIESKAQAYCIRKGGVR